MIALLELVLLLLFLPFILFGVVLGHLFNTIEQMFHPLTFLSGVWAFICGAFLLRHMAPDSLPFESIVQVLARSHVLGFTTPVMLIAVGCALVGIAALIRGVAARPGSTD